MNKIKTELEKMTAPARIITGAWRPFTQALERFKALAATISGGKP